MSDAMSAHEQAYTTCAYCPKGCRFSCPVSEATANESLSAWGKMSIAHHVEQQRRPMDAEASRAVHACTGCQRCTSFCKHENRVDLALFAAREASLNAGNQPKGVASTLATFQQSQNPFGRELGSLVGHWRAQSAVRYQLFTGCTALVKAPEMIEDARFVAEAFGTPVAVAKVSSRCCGYPLFAAGATSAFRDHAEAMKERLASTPELVVLDATCAYTLRELYPQVGVKLPQTPKTLIEVLAENLAHAPVKPALPQTVAYHDACHLGRGLGQFDEPRALLSRAAERVLEAPSNRREGGCSGGGGLLPRSTPEVAVEIARRQSLELSVDPNVPIVTACPTSKRMFERAGRTSFSLFSLLRRWVESP